MVRHDIPPCERKTNMKKSIALAVVIFVSRAIATFAGEPISSSKEVISPAPAPPPPPEYFRPNEFDIGAFGTYATGSDIEFVGSEVFRRRRGSRSWRNNFRP